MYNDEIIEKIKIENDIVDVIGSFIKLKGQNNIYIGFCPFHSEKTPSFVVSRETQTYYCFGCGVGGDVVSFLIEYGRYSFSDAIRYLTRKSRIILPQESANLDYLQDKKAVLLQVNKDVAQYFCQELSSEKGKSGYVYFKRRSLSDETIKHFGLGFAAKYSDGLITFLRSKGYSEKMLIESGICRNHEKYGFQCKFWNRVIFPIMDINQRVIGFGGRNMGNGEPKYLNSAETLIFDKGRNLYGLNYAQNANAGNFILCEGFMDVIALHQAGFTQALASLGTSFTSGQANIISKYVKEVYLAYDSDGPGINAAIRAIGMLRTAGIHSRIINLQPHKDPDEFIKNLGREAFEERMRKAEDGDKFEAKMLCQKKTETELVRKLLEKA